MYTHYHFRNSSNNHSHPFKTTSVWKPPLPDNPSLLSYICSVAESIHHTFSHNSHDQSTSNLTQEEINFLATYNIHNQKYVIKPADKGGAIVIWSTTDYEKEALSQLNEMRSRIRSKMRSRMRSKMRSRMKSKIRSKMRSRMRSKMRRIMKSEMTSRMGSKMKSNMRRKMKSRMRS